MLNRIVTFTLLIIFMTTSNENLIKSGCGLHKPDHSSWYSSQQPQLLERAREPSKSKILLCQGTGLDHVVVHSTDKSIANHLIESRFEVTVFGEPAKGCYISCDELCASSLSRIETKCLNYDGRLGVIEVFHCCNEVVILDSF